MRRASVSRMRANIHPRKKETEEPPSRLRKGRTQTSRRVAACEPSSPSPATPCEDGCSRMTSMAQCRRAFRHGVPLRHRPATDQVQVSPSPKTVPRPMNDPVHVCGWCLEDHHIPLRNNRLRHPKDSLEHRGLPFQNRVNDLRIPPTNHTRTAARIVWQASGRLQDARRGIRFVPDSPDRHGQ